MNRNINCPCGKNFIIEAAVEFDLDAVPDTIKRICDGTFMSFDCPLCGKKQKPEYNITLLWKSKNYRFEILTELERAGFYHRKRKSIGIETIIGYREMADRIGVINDGLEPLAVETLKFYSLAKAGETYPDFNISAWYQGSDSQFVKFYLDGIKEGEVALMNIPRAVYDKTLIDIRKHPKDEIYTSLRCRSYLSVQNVFKPDGLK
ncbi:MAG: CpXC domain-containing protein [Treponema sp.]|jgi:hypothetical protein|nr:CpXC domain-containing protein [Treponema sp.]